MDALNKPAATDEAVAVPRMFHAYMVDLLFFFQTVVLPLFAMIGCSAVCCSQGSRVRRWTNASAGTALVTSAGRSQDLSFDELRSLS